MTPRTHKVVLIEDHATLREGLALLLDSEGFDVVGQAGDAARGYELVGETRPQAVVIDLKLPGENGIELTRRLLRRDRDVATLLLTGVEEADLLADALESGARGVAHKAAPLRETLHAVRAIAAGGSYVDPRVRELVREHAVERRERVLTDRERQVLQLVAEGRDRADAAERLSISEQTFRTHVRNAMAKLGVHNRANAVMVALRRGEIDV